MNESFGTRVLMLLENRPFPNDARVSREARVLVAAGYKVTVISPGREGQAARETVDGVRVYRFRAPASGNGLLGYLWEYGYSMIASFFLSFIVFLREGFDVIHAHNPPDLFVLIAMSYRVVGKRFVFDHHDLAPEMYRARFPTGNNRFVFYVLVFLEKLTCRMAHHVIATNESYKKLEMQRGNVPEERITVVRNGPDLNRVRPVEPDPQLRKKATTILGYVGVLGFQDGLDYLLRGLWQLIHCLGREDFYCVIIGDGDARDSLMELATELELDNHVWFTGRIVDARLLRYLSTTDICVAPDPANPFTDRSTMIKMAEYMALAKPSVAFDLTEHRVTAQDSALYARPNDELDFARQINRLMDDVELRQKMGQCGRERVETSLAWSLQEKYLLEAYEKLGVGPNGQSTRNETKTVLTSVSEDINVG